ncbi:MAG: amidohydrolase, partial [Dehalococcoidales bacterium]|nr:amidohydrolase [Dehalococcoidales bacterium]
GAGTRVIDCGGSAVLPGFIDAHLHLFSLIRQSLSIDLSPRSVRSIAEIKELIRRRAAVTPPGQWISGTGYNEFYLAEGRCPTRWDIDEVAPDNPVVLTHRSLHACVLNSVALSLAGITAVTEAPPGASIERDLATGEPNGILIGMLGYIRSRVMPPLSAAELDEGIALVNRRLLSCGITSFHEATYRNDRERWELIRGWQEAGKLHGRVYMMVGRDTYRSFHEAGMATGCGDTRLRLGAVKVMLEVSPDQEALDILALEVHRAGFQLAFHAVAESSIEAAANAIERVNDGLPLNKRRHRIEHGSECSPSVLEHLRRLGVLVVTQPPFVYYSGERYLATVPPEKIPWLYRIRSMLDAGLVVAGSSDAPVVPENPLVGVYAAVSRRAENGELLLPHEAVSAEEALAMYTKAAAYASFEEGIKGSLAPGKLADIVVLNGDPTRVSPGEIRDIRVEMTVIGGRIVWCA